MVYLKWKTKLFPRRPISWELHLKWQLSVEHKPTHLSHRKMKNFRIHWPSSRDHRRRGAQSLEHSRLETLRNTEVLSWMKEITRCEITVTSQISSIGPDALTGLAAWTHESNHWEAFALMRKLQQELVDFGWFDFGQIGDVFLTIVCSKSMVHFLFYKLNFSIVRLFLKTTLKHLQFPWKIV